MLSQHLDFHQLHKSIFQFYYDLRKSKKLYIQLQLILNLLEDIAIFLILTIEDQFFHDQGTWLRL